MLHFFIKKSDENKINLCQFCKKSHQFGVNNKKASSLTGRASSVAVTRRTIAVIASAKYLNALSGIQTRSERTNVGHCKKISSSSSSSSNTINFIKALKLFVTNGESDFTYQFLTTSTSWTEIRYRADTRKSLVVGRRHTLSEIRTRIAGTNGSHCKCKQ